MSIWTDLEGVSFAQRFYDAGGIRTRVIEAGAGEPLIFLHGAGGHAEAFTRNIAEHAKHFRVLCVDMLGHGQTDAPDIHYDMQAIMGHLHALVNALGLEKVSLSGVSLGGMIAAMYAIQHPERVRRLALVTGMLIRRDEAGRRDLKDALDRSRKATETPSHEAVRSRLSWLMHEPEKSVTDELVDVRLRIYAQPHRAKAILAISNEVLGGLLDEEWTTRWSDERLLKGVRCPTLLLWTRYNPGLTAEHAAQGMKFIPDARMLVFENSAHWPQWEEPQRFNREHLDFMLGRA